MNFATAWFNGVGIVEIIVPRFNYNQGTQRENDYRSRVVKTNMTGYLEMKDVTWRWRWSGHPGGSLNQGFRLRDGANNVVYATTGSGSSGSKTFTVTNLDPSQTYHIFMEAWSSAPFYAERAASGDISYTYLTRP